MEQWPAIEIDGQDAFANCIEEMRTRSWVYPVGNQFLVKEYFVDDEIDQLVREYIDADDDFKSAELPLFLDIINNIL